MLNYYGAQRTADGTTVRLAGSVLLILILTMALTQIYLPPSMASPSEETVRPGSTYKYATPFSTQAQTEGVTYTFSWTVASQSGYVYASSSDPVFEWKVPEVQRQEDVELMVVVTPNGCVECSGSSTWQLTIAPPEPEIRISQDCLLRGSPVSPSNQARMGDNVTYIFDVTNTGKVPLTDVSVTEVQEWGPKCTPVYESGDDGDHVLRPGQMWRYKCDFTVPDPEKLYTLAVRKPESEQERLVRKLMDSKIRLEIEVLNMISLKKGFDFSIAGLNMSRATINGTNDTRYSYDKYNYTIKITGEYLTKYIDGNGTVRIEEYHDFITGNTLTSVYNASGNLTSDIFPSDKTKEYMEIRYDTPYQGYRTFTIIDYALGDSLIVVEDPNGVVISKEYRKTPGAGPEEETFTLLSTATASAKTAWGAEVNDTTFYNLVLRKPLPRFAIVKTARPSQAALGNTLTYTVDYSNIGEVEARGVVIKETYDRNVTFVSSIPNPDPGTTNLWTVGPLQKGEAGTFKVTVRLNPKIDWMYVNNTVNITCSKKTFEVFNLSTPIINNAAPWVNITKTYAINGDKSKRIARVGDKVTYTYLVENKGNTVLNKTNVTDDRIGWISDLYNKELNPEDKISASVEHTVNASELSGPLVNTATVVANSTVIAINSNGQVSNKTRASIDLSDIKLYKSFTVNGLRNIGAAKIGDTITYEYNIKSNGSTTLTLTKLTDAFQPNGTIIDIPIDPSKKTIHPGQNVTYTYEYRVSKADLPNRLINPPLNNTATSTGIDKENNVVTNTAKASVNLSALRLTKSANKPVAGVGDTLTYSYMVENYGTTDITLDSLEDNRTADISPDPKDIILRRGKAINFTSTYTVGSEDEPRIVNNATVSGKDPWGTVISDKANASVDVVMRLVKTANKTSASMGEVIGYNYTVWNKGTRAITLSSLTDDLAGEVISDETEIPPGDKKEFFSRYIVSASDLPGPVVNNAVASGTDSAGYYLTSKAFASVNISAIALTKMPDRTTAYLGNNISYSFSIVNYGASDVTITSFKDEFNNGAMIDLTDEVNGTVIASKSSLPLNNLVRIVVNDSLPDLLTNKATVRVKDAQGNEIELNANASVTIIKDVVGMTKIPSKEVANNSEIISYNYTIHNYGSKNVTLKRLYDIIPKSGIIVADYDLSGEDPLEPNKNVTFTSPLYMVNAIRDGTPIINEAEVTLEDGSVGAKDSAMVYVGTSELLVSKSVDGTTVYLGDNLTYTITVTNRVNSIVTINTVTDDKIKNLYPTPGGQEIKPGASRIFTGTYKVTEADVENGEIINTANATGFLTALSPIIALPAFPEGLGQAAKAQETEVNGSGSTRVKVKQFPTSDISIRISSYTKNKTKAGVGDTIEYRYYVSNGGSTNITLDSMNDDKVSNISPSPQGADLVAHDTLSFTGSHIVTERDYALTEPCSPQIKNVVNITGHDEANNEVTGSAIGYTSLAPANLSVTLNASMKIAKVGQKISYTYDLRNDGGVPLSKISIYDDKLGAVILDTPKLARGANTSATATHTVSTKDLPGPLVNRANISANYLCTNVTTGTSVELVNAAVTKTASVSLTAPGSYFNYTLRISNNGSAPASGVMVTDLIDPNLIFDPMRDATPRPNSTTKTDLGLMCIWNRPVLGPGPENASSIELRVMVPDPFPEDLYTVTNRYKIDCDPVDQPVSYSTLDVTVVNHNLWITKTAEKKSYRTGDFVNYSIKYGNAMDQQATDIVVSDDLPAELQFVSASPDPTGVSGNHISWKVGTLDANKNGSANITTWVPRRPNMTYDEASSVSGEGYAYVSKQFDTTYQRKLVENVANITGYFIDPQTGWKVRDGSIFHLLVSVYEAGTRLKSFEHGSGYYQEEEVASVKNYNKSIMVSKGIFAKHRDTTFSLPCGRKMDYRSLWSDRTTATNDIRDEVVVENYRYMDLIDKDTRFHLDENQTVYRSSGTFSGGIADIKFVKGILDRNRTDWESIVDRKKALAEIRESYHGRFNLEEKIDSYGRSIIYAKHGTGKGFTIADFRNEANQRSFEQGSGYYDIDLYYGTGTLYKESNMAFMPNTWTADGRSITYSTKWHEEMFTRDRSQKALISERITSATSIRKDTYISSATMGMYGDIEGTAEIRAIQKMNPDSKQEATTASGQDGIENRIAKSRDETRVEQILSGKFKVDTTISIHASPKYIRPHINITKTAIRTADDSAIFRIDIVNDGNKTLGPVVVTDVLPEGMTFANSSLRPTVEGSTLKWTILSMTIASKQTIELGVRLNISDSMFRNRAMVIAQYNGGQVESNWVFSRLIRDQGRVVELMPPQNNTTINGEGWGGGWTPPWREWDMNSTLCDCDLGKESECDACPMVVAVDLPL